MAATRSRVGTPQAFVSLPYLCLGYLPDTHPNKSVPDNGGVCAFDIGKEIPEPLRVGKRLPLPAVRPCPYAPVTFAHQNPPTSRRSSMAFQCCHSHALHRVAD